jgi:large subunit ribosomal protein L22
MSFGVKTNERPGTRASVRYVHSSAYKAREVLDLIRGEPVARALEILEFSERDIAKVILKCLDSAIANAEANDGQAPDELEVAACFADEGPTLKRWRPRARGRATRIRKRTCHLTVIVGRIDPERLEILRQSDSTANRAGGRAAEARRQRVLRSRQAKADRKATEEEHDHDHDHDHDGDHDHDDEATTDTVTDTDEATTDTVTDTDEATTDTVTDTDTDESPEAEATADDADTDTDEASDDEASDGAVAETSDDTDGVAADGEDS